ncbi:hypothetical protein IQA64_14945 [Leptospira borgpetersenii serovar Tarassovi]|nr:hypothetical protein [Leptospira borgpetersenii serovar Tarassovi]
MIHPILIDLTSATQVHRDQNPGPSFFQNRQNGAPSGLEKRGLDASIYHKTRKPTEGTQ